MVQYGLTKRGFQVSVAASGEEGIELARQQKFDLAICDIMMPDVDGYEVLQRIRSNPATATLPVIFLTAKSTPADIEKGLALGANHYITKPFSGLDLVRKVRLCLGEAPPAEASPAPR